MTNASYPYSMDLAGCFSGAKKALTAQVVEMYYKTAEAGLRGVRKAESEGILPVLSIWKRTDDLEACRPIVDFLRDGASDIVFLGTGGSSLGAQALAQLKGYRVAGAAADIGGIRFHFFDNLDASSFSDTLDRLDLKSTKFLVVSKSGGTAETMIQMLSVMTVFKEQGMLGDFAQHCAVITEPKDNALRRLATEYSLLTLDHDPDIGGRFSVLSNVGLLPAMLMGIDAEAVRQGAGAVMQPIMQGVKLEDCPPAYNAIVQVALNLERGISGSVLMPYADRLELFAMWYRQLWAESLGKNGRGTTPIRALGPVDQHSQLQLYLDGPNDKLITFMMLDTAGRGPHVDPDIAKDSDLAYLAGRTIGDLVDAEQRATAETLVKRGRPVRIFSIPTLDEVSMGALLMHFMVETMLAAHLFDVKAFDQPAVEEGKVLARKYLGKMD